MKALLVISRDSGFAAAVSAGLDAADWQVRVATDIGAAIEQTGAAMLDAVLLDDSDANLSASVGRTRQAFGGLPLIVAVNRPAGQEEALTAGATLALPKPVRIGLVVDWLARQTVGRPVSFAAAAGVASAVETPRPGDALKNLADLKGIVARCLEPEALAREFLLHVRDIIGCNRAAIYLRDPAGDAVALSCIFAAGRPEPTAPLQLTAGIAGQLAREGRVLVRERAADDARREFAAAGAEYAIPILDGQRLFGIVLLDRRVTGDAPDAREQTLLFKAFEVLGIGLARAFRHQAVTAAEELATGVFDTLDTACLVVGADLALLHFNPAARRMFGLADGAIVQDLPATIVSRVFTALSEGGELPRFRHCSNDLPGQVFEVAVKRVPHPGGNGEPAALLTIDDATDAVRTQTQELDTANERLVRAMAEHLAHEMGNTLVPLSTGRQMMAADDFDPETLRGLEGVIGDSVRRIERFTGQMQSLARAALRDVEEFRLAELINEAFADAEKGAKVTDAQLTLDGAGDVMVRGERRALRQAFGELMLNALQSCQKPRVKVEVRVVEERVEIDVRDGGAGFSPESGRRATEPFFSERTVGAGLGLAVARRVVELHEGRLILQPPDRRRGGCVRVELPCRNAFADA